MHQHVHVVPLRNEWGVESGVTLYIPFKTREKAVEFGRQLALKEECQLFIHDRHGHVVKDDPRQKGS